jgi:hypothetical protein
VILSGLLCLFYLLDDVRFGFGLADVVAAVGRRRETNEGTPAMRAARIEWKDVAAQLLRLSRTEYASRRHLLLLLAMYTMIPPRRQADYHRVSALA